MMCLPLPKPHPDFQVKSRAGQGTREGRTIRSGRSGCRQVSHFITFMGAKRYTSAAVNADEGLACGVKVNSVNRTGFRACSAAGTELLFSNNTAPFRREYAPVRQAAAQGAGSQARQVCASKPVDMPPEDAMRIPAVSQDRRSCTSRAQAREQEWQPMQRSMPGG